MTPDTDKRHQIRVDVETNFVDEQSDPRERRFVFAYTITIRNEGPVPARLMTRHWIITDATGHVEEVRGPGVVGKQPVLGPGQSFQYTSGCPLHTPFGTMHGSYQMVTQSGESFDVEVAPFALSEPYTVH
jgi:ApaG protein